MRKIKIFGVLTLIAAVSIAVYATVTFDPLTGIGFVGKGDVQYTLGLNNAGVQALGNPSFTYNATSTKVTEVSWVCTNSNNEHTQERARTTTTTNSVQGIVSSIARERNQITGYILNGYSGTPTITGENTTTDGPPVDSCPASPSTWYLSTPAGAPETITDTSSGGLYVNGVLLQEKPVVVP
jgi:hypothetical protein